METEISGRVRNVELVKIIDWIPKVWHHLNRFLEAHSSSDVTIGRGASMWVGGVWGGGRGAVPGPCPGHTDREAGRREITATDRPQPGLGQNLQGSPRWKPPCGIGFTLKIK